MCKKVRNWVGVAAAAIAAVVSFGPSALAGSIPDMPVDFEALATEGMTTVGKVMAAIAGIIIVIALVRMGFKFLSSAFQGRA